uniref:Uncharacterized protein n=1 Tax=Thermogemmatispora argillosa TaxID=2045280 RepID=A0A455T915_9CHLR|nr:hypothetical protein KTA_41390 [Thermogemmatispora argillosa]
MSRLEPLIHYALIGTRQEQPPHELAPAPFDRLLEELPTALPLERKLLLLAGAEALYGLAGISPFPLGVMITAAPPEKLPPCSPQAAAMIQRVLEQPGSEQRLQALELLARHGYRLPFALLPRMFEVESGSARTAMRSVFAQVIGERGRWLARFQPAWRRLLISSLPVTELNEQEMGLLWQEGSPSERLALLRQLRVHDRPLARQWLEEAWPKEELERRLALLETFEIGLEEADEAFLERLRDQRSYHVRRRAAGLLARLPSSACRRELLSAAQGLLRRETGPEGQCVRAVPPRAYSEEWRRFGIEQKEASQEQRAAWLQALISLVPPSYWEQQLQLSPASIVHGLASDWRAAVLVGLMQATLLHRAPSWARALLSWLDPETQQPLPGAEDLLRCLDQQEAEEFLLHVLASPEQRWFERWPELLSRLPGPWSATFGCRLLEYLQSRLEHLARLATRKSPLIDPPNLAEEWQQWEKGLRITSGALPEACFDHALQVIQASPLQTISIYYVQYTVIPSINAFLEKVAFLRDLQQELRNQ